MTPLPITITDFDPGETEALVRMWRTSFEHGVGIVDPNPIEAQIGYFEQTVRPAHRVQVARLGDGVDGEGVGATAGATLGPIVGFIASNEHSVSQLHVRVDLLGQGIGTRLLDLAKQQSAGRLWLYTFARNHRARRFYESRGFVAVAFGFEPTWQLDDLRYEWMRPA
jgi:ribosomal protein S18 acetylase RimI-like enzyme